MAREALLQEFEVSPTTLKRDIAHLRDRTVRPRPMTTGDSAATLPIHRALPLMHECDNEHGVALDAIDERVGESVETELASAQFMRRADAGLARQKLARSGQLGLQALPDALTGSLVYQRAACSSSAKAEPWSRMRTAPFRRAVRAAR